MTNDVVTVLQQYQHTGISSLYNQESLLVPGGGLNLRLMNPLPDGWLWKATTEKVESNWRHAQFIEISHNQEYHDNKPMCMGSHEPILAQQLVSSCMNMLLDPPTDAHQDLNTTCCADWGALVNNQHILHVEIHYPTEDSTRIQQHLRQLNLEYSLKKGISTACRPLRRLSYSTSTTSPNNKLNIIH